MSKANAFDQYLCLRSCENGSHVGYRHCKPLELDLPRFRGRSRAMSMGAVSHLFCP